MPSKSKAQAGFMAVCGYAPSKARGKCPPKSVAREFAKADAAQRKRNWRHMHK